MGCRGFGVYVKLKFFSFVLSQINTTNINYFLWINAFLFLLKIVEQKNIHF